VQLTRRDAGFTLVELLIAVVILGLITLPLGNAVIGVLHNYNDTSDRLALSHDAQISAAFFARDVAATGIRDYSGTGQAANGVPFKASIQADLTNLVPYNAGGVVCGDATTPAALFRFLSDDWTTSGSAPVEGTDVVAYYLSGSELHRLKCAGGTTSGAILAHNVDPGSVKLTCSAGACDGAATPQQVTLTFTTIRPGTTYPVTLSGQWRQS
jgi:prepilin-type N-terminal cleavage/methylation domain-containing protein